MITSLLVLALSAAPPQYYQGNTHTHTLWSDGDGAPEAVVAWYVTNGYDFLVLSDHNIMQVGEDWFPIAPGTRLTQEKVEGLREHFGPDWPDLSVHDGKEHMRLRTLAELKVQFEKPGAFLLVPGEEVTDRFEKHEIHINAINIDAVVQPQRGGSVQSTIQRNFDAIRAQGAKSGREVFAHLNHPNFVWSLTVEDVASLKGERFFEIYNGHRSVHNEGDSTRPSTEEMWDQALVLRLRDGAGDGELLYGVATDDAHSYGVDDGVSIPGRGWVMVRAAELSEEAIVLAMKAGEFYSSSGVSLKDVNRRDNVLTIEIDAEDGVEYTTEFIATRVNGEPGEVLATSKDLKPTFTFVGDELYIRARITSSKKHPRPYRLGDFEMAWTQPVRPDATLLKQNGETDDRTDK